MVNAGKMKATVAMVETGQMLETGEILEMVNAVKMIAKLGMEETAQIAPEAMVET